MWRYLCAAWFALVVCTVGLFARSGGGCVAAGTFIATPDGPRAIETLQVGDAVWSWQNGRQVSATVQAFYAVEPVTFIEVVAGGHTLRVTPEHPVQTAPGEFVRAEQLPGSAVLFTSGSRAPLTSIRRLPADRPAYNLLVSPGGVFFANNLLVHNKGCFLPDTPVTLADGGRRAISRLRAGDEVLAFTNEGVSVPTTVRHVITHEVERYLIVRTATIELHVTEEHPFYVGAGTFKTIESLHVGDPVYAFDGTHRFNAQAIVSIEQRLAHATVYNIEVDAPHTFLANGIAVHNKGGGGSRGGGSRHRSRSSSGSSYRGGTGGDSPGSVLVFVLIVGGLVLYVIIKQKIDAGSIEENLDYCFPRSAIEPKAAKTRKLIDFIARTDADLSHENLVQLASNTFRQSQENWSLRDYEPMRPLMMSNLFAEHSAQLRGMIQTHEINRLDNLRIEQVDIVHLHYEDKKDQCFFTALLTVWLRDYYVDDRNATFLRGDKHAARFQEFWVFQFFEGAWRLREIEQSRESDYLKLENFFAAFTETGRDQIYGETAGRSGPAGPDLPADVQTKDANIDRLLNFLVVTDKIWDRETMLATARRVYLSVLLAWQDGRPEMFVGVPATAEVAARLRGVNEANQLHGWRVEYRNLCVRKVEIVHVNNRHERGLDEFTVRISAHAQVIATHNGTERHRDEFVKPWVEFWTFVRADYQWTLKEILPGTKGAALVALENVDEGSSSQMLEWYYSKERAT